MHRQQPEKDEQYVDVAPLGKFLRTPMLKNSTRQGLIASCKYAITIITFAIFPHLPIRTLALLSSSSN